MTTSDSTVPPPAGQTGTTSGRAFVLRGNARAIPLPDASVDLIVTSPPDGARSGALPEWADEWYGDDARCTCHARLCFVHCPYCAGHIACSRTGTSPTHCAPQGVS